jgi:hypothetical protein
MLTRVVQVPSIAPNSSFVSGVCVLNTKEPKTVNKGKKQMSNYYARTARRIRVMSAVIFALGGLELVLGLVLLLGGRLDGLIWLVAFLIMVGSGFNLLVTARGYDDMSRRSIY